MKTFQEIVEQLAAHTRAMELLVNRLEAIEAKLKGTR